MDKNQEQLSQLIDEASFFMRENGYIQEFL